MDSGVAFLDGRAGRAEAAAASAQHAFVVVGGALVRRIASAEDHALARAEARDGARLLLVLAGGRQPELEAALQRLVVGLLGGGRVSGSGER